MYANYPTLTISETYNYTGLILLGCCLVLYITGWILIRLQRKRFWYFTDHADHIVNETTRKIKKRIAKSIKRRIKS